MHNRNTNNSHHRILAFGVESTTITFTKTNGISVTKYGHVCLPKRIYRQLHAAWGKEKTVGTCRIGSSCFECYIDWVESKTVWMLRLKQATSAVVDFGKRQNLKFHLEVDSASFELSIAAVLSAESTVQDSSQVASMDTRRGSILPFEGAREYVRALGLKSMQDWISYSKSGYRPKFIPSNPWTAYKGEYTSINNFIGGKSSRRRVTRTPNGEGR